MGTVVLYSDAGRRWDFSKDARHSWQLSASTFGQCPAPVVTDRERVRT